MKNLSILSNEDLFLKAKEDVRKETAATLEVKRASIFQLNF